MAEIKIEFDPELYGSYLSEEITLEGFLTSVFDDMGNPMDEYDGGSKGVIAGQLLSYHSDDGGSPEFDNLVLSDHEYNNETKNGSVVFTYDIGYYYSCDDMNKEEEHYEKVNFEIDNNTIILHFIDKLPRTTREEF